MSISRLVFFAAALSVAASATAHETHVRGVAVAMDHVTIVAFKDPFATIYIGNPSVADFTVIDSRHIFVLGKAFGSTNLIALNADKSIISNQTITVFGQSAGVVTVNRGPETFTYTCTPARCETNPLPGDQKTYFENMTGEAGAHQEAGSRAALASAQSQR